MPGVRTVEAWGYSPSAIARPGAIDLVRTYPDRAHGSLAMLAPPPATTLVELPLLAGRWLAPDDTDAVVLNHVVRGQAPDVTVGDTIALSVDATPKPWRVVGIVEDIGSPGVAYVTDRAFAAATDAGESARMLRIATDATTPAARTEILLAIERELDAADIGIEAAIPLSELRSAVGDHIVVLIRLLLAMAGVMATVGALGLASAMGTSVLERTREIGVMKALGATPRRILTTIMSEALVITSMSWVLAVLLSLPVTALLDQLLGSLGFLAPLPFVIAALPPLVWFGVLGVAGLGATLLPARRAAAVSAREALARV